MSSLLKKSRDSVELVQVEEKGAQVKTTSKLFPKIDEDEDFVGVVAKVEGTHSKLTVNEQRDLIKREIALNMHNNGLKDKNTFEKE